MPGTRVQTDDDEILVAPAVLLPPMLRDTLAALVRTFTPVIGAPVFCADLQRAVESGDVREARSVLRGFGRVSFSPYANVTMVRVVGAALENVFGVAETHARAFAEWRREVEAAQRAGVAVDTDHEARMASILDYIDTTVGLPTGVPPKPRRKAPKAGPSASKDALQRPGTEEADATKGTHGPVPVLPPRRARRG